MRALVGGATGEGLVRTNMFIILMESAETQTAFKLLFTYRTSGFDALNINTV